MSSSKKRCVYPLNRVDGDLEVHIETANGRVTDAWSVGTMYRGIENIMTGRSVLDSLVITPRVCGICTTAHLLAAAKALDMLYGAQVPDNAIRVRNIAVMVEMLQNDMRQSFLLFCPDFTQTAYDRHPLYSEACHRYKPLKGATTIQAIGQTKAILGIIAILGGQWPHSSFMVPGGVLSITSASDLLQCRHLLRNFRHWYEQSVLGCSLAAISDLKTASDLDDWLTSDDTHAQSELGFFVRFARQADLDTIGKGYGRFLCVGGLEMPQETRVQPGAGSGYLLPPGIAVGHHVNAFDQLAITEDVSASWYRDENAPMHPQQGKTIVQAPGGQGKKYSWAKAPRYHGLPAETGPLAQLVMARHPLISDLIKTSGPSVLTRVLARLLRPSVLLPAMDCWLQEIVDHKNVFFNDYPKRSGRPATAYGLIEAPRGALGHWISVEEETIQGYQIVTPTAWNASPRDGQGNRGPWEQAVVGTKITDNGHPVAVDHIIRSFDPCLVCTVHMIDMI